MFITGSAPSERADACVAHRIHLAGLPPAEAETITLVFEIMGWQVTAGPAPPCAQSANVPGEAGDAAMEAAPRLAFAAADGIITVVANDPPLNRQLARLGLDRLVSPVRLSVLEELLLFAA